MASVADQNDSAALVDIALAFVMNLGDKRTDGIEHSQIAGLSILFDRARNPMRAKDRHRARRNLRKVLDETCAFRLETFDDVPVVNNFVTDINGRPESMESPLDDLDRPHHTGTKPARLRQDNPEPHCSPSDLQLARESGMWSSHFLVA
jgi:hypothetical protein